MKEKIGHAFTCKPKFSLWNLLGFGECHVFIDDKDHPDMVPSYLQTFVVGRLGWSDWMRLLISRRIMVATAMKTDKIILRCKSESKISILPPGFKI